MKAYQIWRRGPRGEETAELFCEECAARIGEALEVEPEEVPWEALRVRLEMTGRRFVSCSACAWVLLAIP
jgi:hypothetical protein